MHSTRHVFHHDGTSSPWYDSAAMLQPSITNSASRFWCAFVACRPRSACTEAPNTFAIRRVRSTSDSDPTCEGVSRDFVISFVGGSVSLGTQLLCTPSAGSSLFLSSSLFFSYVRVSERRLELPFGSPYPLISYSR